jgi:hypothetical protein
MVHHYFTVHHDVRNVRVSLLLLGCDNDEVALLCLACASEKKTTSTEYGVKYYFFEKMSGGSYNMHNHVAPY